MKVLILLIATMMSSIAFGEMYNCEGNKFNVSIKNHLIMINTGDESAPAITVTDLDGSVVATVAAKRVSYYQTFAVEIDGPSQGGKYKNVTVNISGINKGLTGTLELRKTFGFDRDSMSCERGGEPLP